MTFTNIAAVGFYLQCCHREVEPGGSFRVPWERARTDRGLRMAMNAGQLAWREDRGEAKVPGSPRIPNRARAVAALGVSEASAATAAAVRAHRAKADAGVKANQANAGRYDIPQEVKREVRTKAVETEKPVTRADLITDGRPKSLADIRKHNKAVHAFGGR